MAIQTTRIYIVVLTTGIFVIAFYSSLADYKRSIEVSNPSRTIFEHLHSLYLLTLTCACTQLAMPQKQILTIIPPRFHQVTQYHTSYVCKIEKLSTESANENVIDVIRHFPQLENSCCM